MNPWKIECISLENGGFQIGCARTMSRAVVVLPRIFLIKTILIAYCADVVTISYPVIQKPHHTGKSVCFKYLRAVNPVETVYNQNISFAVFGNPHRNNFRRKTFTACINCRHFKTINLPFFEVRNLQFRFFGQCSVIKTILTGSLIHHVLFRSSSCFQWIRHR